MGSPISHLISSLRYRIILELCGLNLESEAYSHVHLMTGNIINKRDMDTCSHSIIRCLNLKEIKDPQPLLKSVAREVAEKSYSNNSWHSQVRL